MNKPATTFLGACREFFGQRDGQTALDFGKELKQLTEQDRKEITEGLTALGYNIVAAPGASTK